jgi:hypothetical protein
MKPVITVRNNVSGQTGRHIEPSMWREGHKGSLPSSPRTSDSVAQPLMKSQFHLWLRCSMYVVCYLEKGGLKLYIFSWRFGHASRMRRGMSNTLCVTVSAISSIQAEFELLCHACTTFTTHSTTVSAIIRILAIGDDWALYFIPIKASQSICSVPRCAALDRGITALRLLCLTAISTPS